jgi:SH3-like domain-containing protein
MRAIVSMGVTLALWSASAALSAAEPAPYFVSLKSDEVFMREGPSDKHRVKWVYRRKGLPLEVLASFEVWRRVKDMDGEIGWVHVAMLSRERTAMVAAGGDVPVRRGEDGGAEIIASAKPFALGRLVKCAPAACEVRFDTAGGWIDRARLWGIHGGREF